jgi:catechol 2,3-dioxygenase-like lactoylglutathione lyase family enzyme
MTNITVKYAPVTVDDVEAAIAFYAGGLGLEVRNDVASGGYRWVTLGSPGGGGTELVLSEPGGGRSPEDAAALHALLAKGALPFTVFEVADVDATFERVRATGAEVLQEPVEQPWGPRDCAFRDPSGNTVRINQAG